MYERTHLRHHSKRAQPVVPQPAHTHVSFRAADVPAHHLRLRGQPGRGQPAHGMDGHGPIAAEPRLTGVVPGIGPLSADRPAAQRERDSKRSGPRPGAGDRPRDARIWPRYPARPPHLGADPGGWHQFQHRVAGFGLYQPIGGRLFGQRGHSANAVAHDGPRGHGHHEPEDRACHRQRRAYGSIPT